MHNVYNTRVNTLMKYAENILGQRTKDSRQNLSAFADFAGQNTGLHICSFCPHYFFVLPDIRRQVCD